MASSRAQIELLISTARYDEAIAQAKAMLSQSRGSTYAMVLLVRALEAAGRFDEAIVVLESFIPTLKDARSQLMPRRALAEMRLRLGKVEAALKGLDAGLRAVPGAPGLLACKATALIDAGRLDEAGQLLERAEFSASTIELALVRSRLRERQGRLADAANDLRAGLNVPGLPAVIRRMLLGQLGLVLDRLGEPDAAMDAWAGANALEPRTFDETAHDRLLERLREMWTPETIAAARDRVDATSRPIYILGMPRSGTSLCERVLAAHPDVHAGGERTEIYAAWSELYAPALGEPGGPPPGDDAIRSASVRVRDAQASAVSNATRLTDKAPQNFLFMPLLAILSPGSTIVRCRRDNRDVGLSCYAQQLDSTHAYACDLGVLGRYIRSAESLMDHWAETLAHPSIGMRVHDHRYEDLATSPEPTARALLDACGLIWHEACLRPHETSETTFTASRDQVTSPIHAGSVGRWKAYESHLAPMLKALAE